MRFEAMGGSRADVDTIGVGGVIISVTEVNVGQCGEEVSSRQAVFDVNHAEALAHGILAACKELAARAVST